jgi:pyruvate dehydrogenase E2 component (dihydrolipoamide acetyltransferase)
MPKMSMTMTEGVFLTWHKAPGDEIREGEVVCEVSTDKVDMEVEAPLSGTLTRLLATPEDVIPVGQPIAYLTADTEALLGDLLDPQPPEPSPRPVPEGRAEPPPPAPVNGTISAVPAARRLATERGIDLTTITPTGPWNTIRLSDVPERPGRSRAAIASRMTASTQVPQFVLYRDLDLETRTHNWTVHLTHAFAAALRRHPDLNATWRDGTPERHTHVGVALAVDTERGLLAPVLTDPDLATLDALAARIDDVVTRARTGKLTLAELTTPAATTVSNLGNLGITAFQTLLTPPQATALAVGAVEQKVVPVPGGIGVRRQCTVGLTVDHRVADGAAAARLLATLQGLL